MSDDYPYQARDRVLALVNSLRTIVNKDPEQDVLGWAVPVVDAVIEQARGYLGDDPVVAAMAGLVSPENIAAGEPIRAAEALILAEQLEAAFGEPPGRAPSVA
jgi:hypothetical protein